MRFERALGWVGEIVVQNVFPAYFFFYPFSSFRPEPPVCAVLRASPHLYKSYITFHHQLLNLNLIIPLSHIEVILTGFVTS